jgi:hypothetical protein
MHLHCRRRTVLLLTPLERLWPWPSLLIVTMMAVLLALFPKKRWPGSMLLSGTWCVCDRGELGDDEGLFCWDALLEMPRRVMQRLGILQADVSL